MFKSVSDSLHIILVQVPSSFVLLGYGRCQTLLPRLGATVLLIGKIVTGSRIPFDGLWGNLQLSPSVIPNGPKMASPFM
jgi:hypothetical protein